MNGVDPSCSVNTVLSYDRPFNHGLLLIPVSIYCCHSSSHRREPVFILNLSQTLRCCHLYRLPQKLMVRWKHDRRKHSTGWSHRATDQEHCVTSGQGQGSCILIGATFWRRQSAAKNLLWLCLESSNCALV